MPVNRIVSTKRGKAAVVAALLTAASGAYGAYTAAHPTITPAAIHKMIEAGITPPAVDLAVNKLIKPWEGLVLKAHWDRFARKYDICVGDTLVNGKPVTKDMHFTEAECMAILKVRVTRDYYLPLVDSVDDYVLAPISVQASMLSGAYNFGIGAAEDSHTADFVTEHKYRQACEAQTAFNKAGGHTVPGLVLRREMGDAQRLGEAEICVSGL